MDESDWIKMTELEKLDFLHRWCRVLARQMEQQGEWMTALHHHLIATGDGGGSLPQPP
jgi:hypothetical protein